jgi:hypothetical protein
MAFPARVWLMESRLGGRWCLGSWDGGEGTSTYFIFLKPIWAWKAKGCPAFLSSLIIDKRKSERKGSSQETTQCKDALARFAMLPAAAKDCRLPALRLPLTFFGLALFSK